MTAARSCRVVAVIMPGDGPHLVALPAADGPCRGSLADALAACLTLLDHDPERFQHAAASWHARWCVDAAPVTLVETHTALTALESLAGPNRADAARVLRYVCATHGQPGIAAVLDSWIAQRGERPATPRLAPPWPSVRAV
jgi:hypothetical protein